jgi:REP element-mobilizing transposase RayT
MSTYTQILYQLVFTTKERKKTLTSETRPDLYKYIWGILKNKKCHTYRINGIENHLHLIIALHPTISLSSLIKDIKLSSTEYIKNNSLFRHFDGWQIGYGAFTYSIKEKNRLIEYVKNQENHHKVKTFKEELIELLQEHEIEFDEKYLL